MSKIKLNPKTEAKILEALEDGGSYSVAAAAAGIHTNTLIAWIKKGLKERAVNPYKDFVYRLRLSEAKASLFHLRVLKEAAASGQWRASKAVLESLKTIDDYDLEEPKTKAPISDYRTFIMSQLLEIQESMSAAKKSESWQAYAALIGKSLTMMEHLRALDAEEGRQDSMDSMTDEKLIKTITDYIVSLPKGLRQRVEEELSELSNSNVVILRRS